MKLVQSNESSASTAVSTPMNAHMKLAKRANSTMRGSWPHCCGSKPGGMPGAAAPPPPPEPTP